MGIALRWIAAPAVIALLAAGAAAEESLPFQERSLAAPALQRALGRSRDESGWNLNSLVAAALLLNGEIELARAQMSTAEAGLITAGARPNPSLALAPQFTTPLRTYQSGTYSANLDLPIETAGKRGWRREQAGQLAAAGRSAVESAAWQVRARVRLNLLSVYAAEQRFDLLKKSVKHQMETAEMLQRRLSAGESSRPELLQTRLLYNQTELALADAARLKAESRAGVADAIGLPLVAVEKVELEVSPFARLPRPEEVIALCRNALERRSDLRTARAERDASVAAVRGELAKRFPDLHLLPGYSFDEQRNKLELGLSFELPVFQQNQGPIAEARGRVAQAEARWHLAEAKASGEIDLARVSFQAAVAKLQTAERLLAEQEKGIQAAQRLFEAGETDRLVLGTTEVERDASAVLRLDALIEAQRALGAVELAAQATLDHWQPSILPVDPPASVKSLPRRKSQ